MINEHRHLLTDYQCNKKNKNVLILSTMHNSGLIEDSENKKPKTVTFYNKSKF